MKQRANLTSGTLIWRDRELDQLYDMTTIGEQGDAKREKHRSIKRRLGDWKVRVRGKNGRR